MDRNGIEIDYLFTSCSIVWPIFASTLVEIFLTGLHQHSCCHHDKLGL